MPSGSADEPRPHYQSRNPSNLAAPLAARVAAEHGCPAFVVDPVSVDERLPGPGAVYISQNLNFRAPVRPGDTVSAEVSVREVHRERARVLLRTVCKVGETVVIDGEALVRATSMARRKPPTAA